MLQDGEIGDIVAMRSQFHFMLENGGNDIRISPLIGGGVLYDLGCYCLNIQHYLIGEPISEVKVMSDWYNGVDVRVSAVVRYESRVIVQIDCSFSGNFTGTFDVIGSKGAIHLPYAYRSDINNH